jgi:hypothetical protein
MTEEGMRRVWILSVAIGAGLVAQIGGATQASVSVPVPAAEESDEVIVRGTPLWELRENVIKAEDRFYARYNELNKVDDFDVECRWSAPTGSHVMRRSCLTRLAVRVNQEYATNFVSFLADTGPAPDLDPHIGLLDRYGEFKDNVQYLLKVNPDLRRLVQERAATVKRYNDERRKYFKGRLVVYK